MSAFGAQIVCTTGVYEWYYSIGRQLTGIARVVSSAGSVTSDTQLCLNPYGILGWMCHLLYPVRVDPLGIFTGIWHLLYPIRVQSPCDQLDACVDRVSGRL